MTSKKTSTVKRFNPWMIVSIVLLIILAGFIFYYKSPTFQKNVNYIFGITNATDLEIGVTVLNDESYTNPPYDLDEQIANFKEEIKAKVNISKIDINSNEGKEIIEKYNLKTAPVLLFDEEFSKTSDFEESKDFFENKDDVYILRLKPYTYLQVPSVSEGHIKGVLTDDAPVTVIEYASFSCGYCSKMREVVYEALANYPNQIRYVYKHYNRGGVDIILAGATECADEEEKFWEMHDYIFDNIDDLKAEDADIQKFLTTGATQIGLSDASFQECLTSNRYAQKITDTTNEAKEYGVSGTPGLFVNDKFVGGYIPYEDFSNIINLFIQ